MLLFRSEEHVDRWCQQWHMSAGEQLSLEQTWKLALAWYSEDRRESHWRRRTIDENQTLLAELGLTSPFWNLR